MTYTYSDYEAAAQVIRGHSSLEPKIGLVLGSGLGTLADELTDRVEIPYSSIPGWPASTVAGHSGQLVIGRFEGKVVAAQQGRAHFYEGYDLAQVTFPIRVMKLLGIDTVFLTNAAGGLNKRYRKGDLMLIVDHINMTGFAGHNPLMGPNDEHFGPRFLGMVHTYDRRLRGIALQVAQEAGITVHEGVYVCLAGPNFETPAEIRMLRAFGDAVGMSTVHEVIVARHAGMRVMAYSGITNEGIDTVDFDVDVNHEEVLDAGKVMVPKLATVLRGVLRAI